MATLAVIVAHIASQPLFGFTQVPVSIKIDLLVLHTAPETFDKHVVDPATFTVHADSDIVALEPEKFRDVQRRLEADGFRFLPYYTLDDPEKHAKVRALHAEAKRDMPLFEPVVTAEFDDVEDEATLPETVMVAVMGDEIVGVSSANRGDSMLHFGLTAVTAPHRYRGIGRVLKTLSAAATKDLGYVHINSGGAGTDTPILHVNRALGFEIEPAWLTLARR